jgi:hypothetical protein
MIIISLISSKYIPDIERQSLYDLYNSTNGSTYWIWQNESTSGDIWNFNNNSSDICTWQGISCTCNNNTEYHQYDIDRGIDTPYGGFLYYHYYDDYELPLVDIDTDDCHIDKIYLSNYNLTGSLPSSISNLKNLSHIHFVDNHLTKTV